MTNAPARTVQPLLAPCLRDIARWAAEAPQATALMGAGQPAISFERLVTGIASVARALQAAGVTPGDVVAVAMPDGPGFVTALLGAMEAAAAAPIDWQLTEPEFRSRLSLLKPSILLVCSKTAGHGAGIAHSLGIPAVELDFDAHFMLEIPRRPVRVPETCALVLQTSATTGQPKLVPLTHNNLHAICAGVQRGLVLQPTDRYLSIMPLHHILGFSSVLAQLMAGGSVACTGFDAAKFRAWITELNPTWYAAGPALHHAILETAKQDPGPFHRSPLRFVRCGSGAGSPALLTDLERVLKVNVVNGYGLTEVGPATNTPPHLPRKTGSVGRTTGPEIAIMDARGNLLAAGSEGEVVLRGEAVMDGYLDAADANREAFHNGWFRTGDLGRMDDEGDLFITGRIKEIINRGGESISPQEIDNALAEHPGILRVASFGVPHPTLGEDIVAAVVLRRGARAAASEVRGFLAERLSRTKIPSRIWFVESIPLSAGGKPLRDALRMQFQASDKAPESQESPAPEDESTAMLRQRVRAAWMRVLNCDSPGGEDSFFGMGGDSLSAARLFALLESEFQFNEGSLDLAQFLDSPTFFQLVQVVVKRTHRELRFEDVSAVCLQPSGNNPPLFFFPGETVEPWYLRHLVRRLGDRQPFFALRHQLADPAGFPEIASRFVTLISRIRPDGPIVLAGHCYGGILAYDVAQRMIAMSRPDVAVVLIDVARPGFPKARVNGYLKQLPGALRAFLRGEGARLAAEVAEHFHYVRALRDTNRRAKQELSVPRTEVPENPASDLSPGAIVLRTYVPQPFPGLLANALADGNQSSERVLQDSRKGWRELARGRFQEATVLGQHNSVFEADNVPALASFIQCAIEDLGVPARPAVP